MRQRSSSSLAVFGVVIGCLVQAACTSAPGPEPAADAKSVNADAMPTAEPTPTAEPPPNTTAVAATSKQPCVIKTQAVDPTHHLVCVRVRALSVAGQPARVCAPSDYVDTMTYDDRGRVTNDGMYAYVHGHGGSAKATWLGGAEPDSERVHPASFDAQGRLTRLGNRKFTYDAEGHLTRAKSGKHFESWAYKPDGTYAYTNNFPDSWEDCEADLIAVKRDKRGLNTVEVYDGCQIAATPATLTITRDAAGRPTKIDVDTHHDGTIEFTITADYSCHGG